MMASACIEETFSVLSKGVASMYVYALDIHEDVKMAEKGGYNSSA